MTKLVAAEDSPNRGRDKTLIRIPWWVVGPALTIVLAIIVHLVFTIWPWPSARGVAPLAKTLADESQLQAQLLVASPFAADFVQTVMRETRSVVLDSTQIRAAIQRLNQRPMAHEQSLEGLSVLASRPLADLLRAFALSVQIVSMRTAVLLLSAIPLVLLMLAMTVDGLVARDLRRRRAGPESGFIYHRAKRAFMWIYHVTWIAYLTPWWVVDPRAVVAPALLGMGVTARIGTAWFKKRL